VYVLEYVTGTVLTLPLAQEQSGIATGIATERNQNEDHCS
jgi:hypothetical protein